MTLAEIEEAAARWVLKRESTQWTPADQAELDRWLQASPSHRVSFMRLGTLWHTADQLKSLGAAVPQGQVPPRGSLKQLLALSGKAEESSGEAIAPRDALTSHPGQDPAAGTRRWATSFGNAAIATSVLLLTAVGLYVFLHAPVTYATAIGGLSKVRTHDGSTIELNTATEIKVTVTDTKREIKLVRGEAFFEVVKDSVRPFTVYAGQHKIIALGTQFSVWKKPDSVHVAVVEGSVRVVHGAEIPKIPPARKEGPGSTSTATSESPGTFDSGDKRASEDIPPMESTTLSAGMVADIQGDPITPRSERAVDIERSLAWRHGYINLRGASLYETISEFNRYTTRQIVIGDPALRSFEVGGSFRVDNMDGFLRLLENFGIHSEEQNGRIMLTRVQADQPGM